MSRKTSSTTKQAHHESSQTGREDVTSSASPQSSDVHELSLASDVSRRSFLAMGAGVSATLAATVLLENCGPVTPGQEGLGQESGLSEGSKEATGADASGSGRETGSGRESGKEATNGPEAEPGVDASEAGPEGSESSVEEPNQLDESELPEEVMTEEAFAAERNQEPPEVPGDEPEVDLRGESVPESRYVAFDLSKFPEDKKLFPLGVQSGAMRADSILLWSFLSKPTTATVKVWEDSPGPQPNTVLMVHNRTVSSNKDGYIKVQLGSLQPATWYKYAFFQGQKRSIVGRFRTAFGANSLLPLTIGATTCTNNSFAPFESLQMLAKESIDMIVHLGDMSYNDSARDLSGYRKKWRGQLVAGGYKELLPTAGMYLTWDDHEIDNNWDPEKFDAKRLAAAKQAFFETLPVERGPNDQLWRSYVWGQTAEIFVLDSRGERKPSTRRSKNPIYLSKAQMTWLKNGLKNSKAVFKILLNSVPMTNMPAIWLSQSDRWEGYGTQRNELLNHLTSNNIQNVWFLSGDFHVGFISKLEPKGAASKYREVAVGPGDSFPNPLGLTLPTSQFQFRSSSTRVMTTLSFEPRSKEVRIRFVNAANKQILFDKILK